MSQDTPFDRTLRRTRRDRAARAGAEDADYLHRVAADEMLARLDLVKREFRRVLVVGCGSGYLTQVLRAQGMEVVSADAGFGFARAAGGVQCDEDRLPFADGAFDLVVSAGVLDSVNDLPGALILIRRALKPDGLFLGAFAGAGSLPQLRSAMYAADEAEGGASPRIHPQIDVRSAGDLLTRAGFTLPVADTIEVDIRFSSLFRLIADLRAMGGTNALGSRGRPLGRKGIAAAATAFAEAAEADGKTRERFEIVQLTAWSPSPDQPQPAKRGSGSASLAAVLGRKS